MTKKTTTSFSESLNTPWFGVTLGLIGVIVGYSAAQLTGPTISAPSAPTPTVAQQPTPTPTPPAPEAGEFIPVDQDEDWILGDKDAEITLIEWSDYECPFCARHHSTPKTLLEAYDGKVNWVYRHYPLGFHQNAQKAAEASECAGELGGNEAFWAFSDLLFEQGVTADKYAGYAEELSIDVADFTECLDSGKYADEVAKDTADGGTAGVTGTPGNLLVNNKTGETRLISGAQPVSAFEAAIDELLQ